MVLLCNSYFQEENNMITNGKKCILLLVLALGLIFQMAVYGGGRSETTASGGVKTVRIWTNDAPHEAVIRPIIERFNAGEGAQKGIVIDYKVFGGDYHDVLNVALSANQGPELFKFVGTVKEPYIRSGWMIPIDDMPGGPDFLKNWNNITLKGYNVFDGKTYSVPCKVLSTKFMYNKDLLAKSGYNAPPQTWDEMAVMAKKITDDNKGQAYGYGTHLKDTASSGKWYFAVQFATSCGHIGYNFQDGRFQFADFAPNMKAILKMKADGSIFPGAEGLDGQGVFAQFAAGRIAMVNGVNWDVANVDTFWKELGTSFNLGVSDTPVVNTARKYRNYAQIADMMCLGSAARKMPEASMIAYSLIHSDEVLLQIQNNEIDYIPREDIQRRAPAQYKKAGTAEFADTSASYFALTPPDGGMTIEGQPYQTTLINIAGGPVNANVDAILQDLDKRYNAALDQAKKEGFDMSPYLDRDWFKKVSR
jgi:multiple sugar transport system substrate-binding protein